MLPRHERTAQLAQLTRQIHHGIISRRTFMARALALGLSISASDLIFRTYRASAQDQGENPITVTVGGTPIAAVETDLSNATPGGTFRFGRAEDSDTLDPVLTSLNSSIWYFMSIYEQLVRVAPDGISLEPSLAESWDISEDGLTYTFHLRPNVLFSDGTPMTSADVLYSWVRAANDPEQHWTFTLTAMKRDAEGQVEGISAPDDATVVVELAQPWVPFLSDVAMFNLSVISKAFAEGNEERLATECMGTGPFALGEFRAGEALTLVKNPHYWEEGSTATGWCRRQPGAGRQCAHPAAPGWRARRHEGRAVQSSARAASRPEPEGLPVSVHVYALHPPQCARGATR